MVENAYGMARDWHIQPSEFWAMSPTEFWWEFDAKMVVQDRIEAQQKRATADKGFSRGEWDDAKKKFKDMKDVI